MAKQILSDEKLDGFAKAVGGGEPPAPQGNEPADAAPSGDTNGAAAPGTTSPKETAEEVVGDQTAGEPRPAPKTTEEPKGPVPYDRFSQVNNERKQYLEKVQEYERQLAEVDQTVRARTATLLEQIAANHPELRKVIYGDEPKTESEAKPPEDPKDRKLWELEREVVENRRFREEMQRRDMIDDIEERCNGAMKKHAIFNGQKAKDHAHEIIANRLIANPKLSVEKIVEDVAAEVRAFEEEVSARYRQKKTETATKIPPGAGGGGAAPPGPGPKKLSLNDGSALRALTAALRGGSGEA